MESQRERQALWTAPSIRACPGVRRASLQDEEMARSGSQEHFPDWSTHKSIVLFVTEYPDLENVSFCNYNLSYQPLSHIHILNLHKLYLKLQDLFLICLAHNIFNSLYNSELGQATGDERKGAPEKRETSNSALPRPSPYYRQQPQLEAEAGIKKFLCPHTSLKIGECSILLK